MNLFVVRAATALSMAFIMSACSSDSNKVSNDTTAGSDVTDANPSTSDNTTGGDTTGGDVSDENAVGTVDISNFIRGALLEDATIVDCTLSGGVVTTCYQLVIQGTPAGDAEVGPFCPETITTTAEDAGIWFDGGGVVHDLDGDFIVNLPNLYGDNNWNLYDPDTGLVKTTTTQTACEGAAQPNVEPEFQNMCVQCSLDYYDGGISQTYLIPTTPVPADAPGAVGMDNVGVSLNGVMLSAPAPVDAILSNYTIASFDDCGGHINPVAGYHYHAATECNTIGAQEDDHADLLGYAFDGYGVFGNLDAAGNEHIDLDECRGTTDETRGYHYHAATAWENTFIGCFSGQTEGEASDERPPRP